MSEQKIKVGYIIHNAEDDVHVLHGGIKKTLIGIYDGTPIETASSVDLSKFLSERKLPLRIDIKTQSKEVTAGTSRTTVTPDEGYVLSEVQIEPTPSEPKTVQAQPGEVLVVEPDDDTALLNRVTVHPVPLQHKEVTPTKSSQTIYPDTGKSFNAVSVKPIPDEYIIPTGNKQITELGKVDVTNYAEAEIVSEDLKPEYIKKDKNILGVVGTLSGEGGTSWDDVYLNNYIPGRLYQYHAQNGVDMYIGSSALNSGIYHINKQTGVLTQIYTSGYYWNYFFEDSKGNVYVGSSSSSGILHLTNTAATRIYATGSCMYFFEDSKGNVYVSGSSSTGVLHLSDTTVTQVYPTGKSWLYFFEDSKGNVYISGSDAGIVYLSGTTSTHIHTSGYCRYFFEDSKGNVYVSGSSSNIGVLHISGITVTQIYTTGAYWQYFFEDSKGNVYVGGGNSNSIGILYLSGITVTQIYTTGVYWQYFFEDSKGNVYVSSSNSNNDNKGILHISGTTATQIYTTGYNWQYFFEDSKGNVYVSGTTTGFIHLSGTTSIQVYSGGASWNRAFEDSKGNVYVSSDSSYNDRGILHLSGTTAKNIYTSGYNWHFKETDHVCAYIDQYPTPESLYLILDGDKAYSVPIYEELLLPSNSQRVTVVPSAETQKIKPENNRTLVEVTVVGDENLKAENIKEGVVLYEGTDNEIVGMFEGGSSSASTALTLDDIEQAPTLTIDYQGVPMYCATNKKDAYLCISTTIYHLNLETNALTKLGEGAEDVQCFFESSNGDIYASTASTASIIYVTPTSISKIYNSGSGWYNFFEDSTGNVYVGSATSNGIIRLKGATATVVYSNGNNWNAFCEGHVGDIYAGSSTNSAGIVYIPKDSTGSAIYTKSNWCYFFRTSTGIIYAGSINESEGTFNKTGILQLSKATANKIYTSGYSWRYFYEDPNGGVYVSSDITEGIIKIPTEGSAFKFYTTGTCYDTYYTHSLTNYTFVTSPNIQGVNILLDMGSGQTGLYGVVSKGYGFKYFKEDAACNLYVSDTYTLSSNSNVVKISADFASVKTIIIKED